MSYLICEECGKKYPLPEGEKSFNYQNCTCGGKLVYKLSSKNDFKNVQSSKDVENVQSSKDPENKQYAQPSPSQSPIKWKGIFIGLLFLFMSLIISIMIIFGDNIPTKVSDIPTKFITYFSILTIIFTIAAGSISSYVSGSKNYLEGALNGGLVGIILGLIIGTVGGVMVFISGTLIFGLLSMAGGIIGILPRKRFNK